MSRSLVGSSSSSTLGSLEQQPQQLEAAPLTAGEVTDPRGEPVAGEAEPLEHRGGRDVLAGDGAGDPADVLDRGRGPARSGSSAGTCWVRCARATVRPCFTRPTSGASSPASSCSTELLPAPLTPTSPTRSPGPSRQVAWESSCRLTARQVDVLEVDDVLAQALGGEALELEPVARWRLVLDEGVRRVDAELRLRRAGGGTAAQPGQLLAGQVLPPRLGRRGLPHPLGLGQHERGVPAVVGVHDAGPVGGRVHLPGAVADGVEEPAVVGDHDQRRGAPQPAPRVEVPGQPGDGLDVEVVGRLVEDQQVVRRPGAAAPASTGVARRRRGRPRCGRGRCPASSTSTISRVRASAAHSWSARPPSTTSRTVRASSRRSRWSR